MVNDSLQMIADWLENLESGWSMVIASIVVVAAGVFFLVTIDGQEKGFSFKSTWALFKPKTRLNLPRHHKK